MLAYKLIEVEDNFISKKELDQLARKYCHYSKNNYKQGKKHFKKSLTLFQFKMFCIDQNIFSKKKIYSKKIKIIFLLGFIRIDEKELDEEFLYQRKKILENPFHFKNILEDVRCREHSWVEFWNEIVDDLITKDFSERTEKEQKKIKKDQKIKSLIRFNIASRMVLEAEMEQKIDVSNLKNIKF